MRLPVNQALGGLSKLSQALRERGRNVPPAESCFELLDQSNELIGHSLDLGCRSSSKVALWFLFAWGRAHWPDFSDLMRSICAIMLAASFRLSSAALLKSSAVASDSDRVA